MEEILIYLFVGSIVGILAGLFGVGGGVIIVPALNYVFLLMDFNENIIIHLSLGTSLSTIIFTSLSSSYSHHKHNAILWNFFKFISIGIIPGTYFGSYIVSFLSTYYLKLVFLIFEFYIATHILLEVRPKSLNSIPNPIIQIIVGFFIGLISALVGIGGGILSTTFLLLYSVELPKAIGTSASLGFPIALMGTIGYILNGWNNSLLPKYSIGFVYLPALLGILTTSVLFAPLGAKLSHKLPIKKLRKYFALFLYLVGIKMFIELFF